MQTIAKSRLATGVALAGAAAVAFGPVTPLPYRPQPVPVVTRAIQPVVNPVDYYAEVIERAAANIGTMIEVFAEHPTPILTQVAANQIAFATEFFAIVADSARTVAEGLTGYLPDQLARALHRLGGGDVAGFVEALLEIPLEFALPLGYPLVAALGWPIQVVDNIANVVDQVLVGAVVGAGLALAGPVLSTLGAAGVAVQQVLDAAGAGDPVEVVNAIVNAPATVVDGLLNGGYGPKVFGLLPLPGLLTARPVGPGPVALGLWLRRDVARAIGADIDADIDRTLTEPPPTARPSDAPPPAPHTTHRTSLRETTEPPGTDDTVEDEARHRSGRPRNGHPSVTQAPDRAGTATTPRRTLRTETLGAGRPDKVQRAGRW